MNPKTIAFYLPQFHPIPENDAWWGKDFTEWRNVERAEPMFQGHDQPVTPIGEFGEYDLRDPAVIAWQTKLAEQNDIDAFCYYHYWFAGKRLLEAPLDRYLESALDMPFLICWANENWSRRWDGKDREVLLAQDYDAHTPLTVFESFVPYLTDVRYFRYNNKAVLLVHRVDHLPDPRTFAHVWRQQARDRGVGELWLVASETSSGLNPLQFGFDAIAEFPPVGDSTLSTGLWTPPPGLLMTFRGRLLSYRRLSEYYIRRETPNFPRHRGLVPRWDNTARRRSNSTIFVGSTPARYAEWLAAARASERAARPDGGLVFINAWNEWAEGAYLEPDSRFGYEYLEATRQNYAAPDPIRIDELRGRVSWPFLRSFMLTAASSLKNSIMTFRRRIVAYRSNAGGGHG